MDYSDLVYAIKNGDQRKADKLIAEAIPILKKYLISKLGATPENAEDSVQRMFEYIIPKIRNGEINSPSGLLSYMLTGSRHSYYKTVRNFDSEDMDVLCEELVAPAEQAQQLISTEYEAVLKNCINKMRHHYRDLLVFLFEYPDADPEDIAEYFDISIGNAWARKHRALQQLSECVKTFLLKK
jgi:DNA-directed RNA polymerase specialized sigma24 family protein